MKASSIALSSAVAFFGVAIFAGFPASTVAEEEAHEQSPLQVTASFSVVADLAAKIGADRVQVASLIPAGSDPHTFDPAPAAATAVARASVILEIGAGFEPWLDDLVKGSGSEAVRIDLSEGIDLIRPEHDHDHGHDHDGEHDHGHGHHHHEFDPHFWNDPLIGAQLARRIGEAFAKADPTGADSHRERASKVAARLEALHAELEKEFASIPAERRRIVTYHDSMTYFARRYELEVIGTLLESMTTEAHDPSAAQVARLAQTMRENNVRAVFPEFGENRKLAEQVAREAGVSLGVELYPGTLSAADGPAPDYESLLKHNAAAILSSLR